tara:strand:- start:867 stop:1274 length:408 start_codon:yes stop_codon:yes gene_type:complete
MSEKKVVNTEYLITRKVVSIEYHRVEANSKAEAIRIVEDGHEDYDTYYSNQHNPKFHSIILIYECPNKHNGWTDVALDVEVGSFDWHYNGMCKGVYQDEDAEMCHECVCAKTNGYRPLTQTELQYLSDSYGVVIE